MNQKLLDIADKIYYTSSAITAIAIPASQGRTLPTDGAEMKRLCAELQRQIKAYIALEAEQKNA